MQTWHGRLSVHTRDSIMPEDVWDKFYKAEDEI